MQKGADKIDQGMERRNFCSLFVLDSLLSRQLDRIPSHPGRPRPENWPQLHKSGEESTEAEGNAAPDMFSERVLQARLADFWRGVGPVQGAEYDMILAEERYDKFVAKQISLSASACFCPQRPERIMGQGVPQAGAAA